MLKYSRPPPGWPQQPRDDLPCPPGLGSGFELFIIRAAGCPWDTFQINLTTLEVYAQDGERWHATKWVELPRRVRARIWHLSRYRT